MLTEGSDPAEVVVRQALIRTLEKEIKRLQSQKMIARSFPSGATTERSINDEKTLQSITRTLAARQAVSKAPISQMKPLQITVVESKPREGFAPEFWISLTACFVATLSAISTGLIAWRTDRRNSAEAILKLAALQRDTNLTLPHLDVQTKMKTHHPFQ
jgi:hypothetical protein